MRLVGRIPGSLHFSITAKRLAASYYANSQLWICQIHANPDPPWWGHHGGTWARFPTQSGSAGIGWCSSGSLQDRSGAKRKHWNWNMKKLPKIATPPLASAPSFKVRPLPQLNRKFYEKPHGKKTGPIIPIVGDPCACTGASPARNACTWSGHGRRPQAASSSSSSRLRRGDITTLSNTKINIGCHESRVLPTVVDFCWVKNDHGIGERQIRTGDPSKHPFLRCTLPCNFILCEVYSTFCSIIPGPGHFIAR